CQLRLLVKLLKSGPSVFLEYRNSYIPTEQAKNVASTFDKILTGVLLTPDCPIGKLDVLSTRNKLQLEKWNSKPLEHEQTTIHGVILETVNSVPNDEAVCAWDGSFTYLELYQHASKIASYLIELGVGPEVFVPLCFDKSKWNVVAILSVLMAGGAFIPLDPAYPEERKLHLIKAVNAKVLLCSRPHVEALTHLVENIIPIDSVAVELLPLKNGALESVVQSSNVAYVIPTSGTTGTPKLTMIEHGNFCTNVKGHVPDLLMAASKPLRALQFAAHTFDASVIENLTPLMVGGTVCIPDDHTRLNDIGKAMNDMRITWACLTPTFVRFLEPAMVPHLQNISLVGEAMSQATLDTWSKIGLANGYGPSECAVAAVCNPKMTATSDPKHIGYPTCCRAWVVDPEDHHRLLPVGCAGELLVEGFTVGRGYLNDPEKTAEVFLSNAPQWAGDRPFRGYLTGDLVIQNIDGSFNYIGRKDSQVVCNCPRCLRNHLTFDLEIPRATYRTARN
ncbi:AMP-binding-domain-containing protein, partial [Delitschia confertaspora ATCC 74209]